MSAWLLSTNHINFLVEGAVRVGIIWGAEATRTGRMLVRANIKSLNARYGDTRKSLGVGTYCYSQPRNSLTDAELLKAAHCYSYQTCEFDGYERSAAGRFIQKMYDALDHVDQQGAEYKAAPWGI